MSVSGMVGGLSVVNGFISWISGNLEALAALLSALATVSLVILYRQQKKILNDQKEFLKLERLCEIELANQYADGDDLEIQLSNYGHGIAKNIRFCTSISAPNSDHIEPALIESRARRLNTDDSPTFEQAIHPHESRVRFRGTPSVAYRLNGEMNRFANFSTAFEDLDDDEIEAIWFQIHVVADDQLGGCQSKHVYSYPRYPSTFSYEQSEDDRLRSVSDESDRPLRPTLELLYNRSGVIPMDEDPGLPSPDCRN